MVMKMPGPEWKWDWEDPNNVAAVTERRYAERGRTDRLEVMPVSPPFGREQLLGLGLSGIEFGTLETQHSSGLSADMVRLWSADTQTEPARIYRVNAERYYAEIDVRKKLPLSDHCVDWVYAEHLIEHIKLGEAIAWLSEVRRVLSPGGLLRLTTPDIGTYAASYVHADEFFDEHRRRMGSTMPGRPAFMMNQIFYLYGHQWIYDDDELRYALAKAGYSMHNVHSRKFREGARLDIAMLDREVRNDETIYLEATA
jgi:predicted SAM-dependent methyltransferase